MAATYSGESSAHTDAHAMFTYRAYVIVRLLHIKPSNYPVMRGGE